MNGISLFVSVFLACSVEAVEATTIVLAAGTARHWRSALQGVAAGLLLLAVVVVGLGPALSAVPLRALRVLVGGLLLIFGLQWLRKAILRASGHKARHDEEEIYRTQLAAARAASTDRRGVVADWYAFTLAFKGVFLEGLEVAFIVLTFGTAQGDIPRAAAGAAAAAVLVGVVGMLARGPLSRVPENAMKCAVGVILSSFGIFWSAEGVGAAWPGGDGSILGIVVFLTVVSLLLVSILRRSRATAKAR